MDHPSKFSMVQVTSLVFTCFNPLGHECLLALGHWDLVLGPNRVCKIKCFIGGRSMAPPVKLGALGGPPAGVNDSECCPEVDPTIVGHPLLHRPFRTGAAPKQIRQ